MSKQKVGLLGVFVFVLGGFQGGLSAAAEAERVMTLKERRQASLAGMRQARRPVGTGARARAAAAAAERLRAQEQEYPEEEEEEDFESEGGPVKEDNKAVAQKAIKKLFALDFMKQSKWNRSFRYLLEQADQGDKAKKDTLIEILNILTNNDLTREERNSRVKARIQKDVGASSGWIPGTTSFTLEMYETEDGGSWKDIVDHVVAAQPVK